MGVGILVGAVIALGVACIVLLKKLKLKDKALVEANRKFSIATTRTRQDSDRIYRLKEQVESDTENILAMSSQIQELKDSRDTSIQSADETIGKYQKKIDEYATEAANAKHEYAALIGNYEQEKRLADRFRMTRLDLDLADKKNDVLLATNNRLRKEVERLKKIISPPKTKKGAKPI